eukprot:SAG31_NODE_10670_length_1111_cov_1.780632_1_plen_56_part_10
MTEAIETARLKMKSLADDHRRTVSDLITVGSRVWLNLNGVGLSRFNLRHSYGRVPN